MKFRMIAALLALSGSAALADDVKPTLKTTTLGCLAKDDMTRFVRILVDNDQVAAKKLLVELMLDGRCRLFDPGTEVNITDTAVFSGIIDVRPQGEVDSYWVDMGHVKMH